MNNLAPPVIFVPPKIVETLESLSSLPNTLEKMEQEAKDDFAGFPLISSKEWQEFSREISHAYQGRDHVILKGLPASRSGVTLLVIARTIGRDFRTYRGGQIVKYFKMSPWTRELSHTTREGEFHTDLNTETFPPALTAMQCFEPDPGSPLYGVSRVARMKDIIAFLECSNNLETLDFLNVVEVNMLNDRSNFMWSGQIVGKDFIRYHPETLRAAERRYGNAMTSLDERIAEIARAAFEVSFPFILEAGDVLLTSNHRTLHYRGECSVAFENYPTEFNSRSIFILHANKEMIA
ncbi:MAG TPA: hypothetical protein VGO50_02555 [Pyrinomonadaceae bacterium]|nr:hypothetical protein [Pyrinomonadaceae bacterium]